MSIHQYDMESQWGAVCPFGCRIGWTFSDRMHMTCEWWLRALNQELLALSLSEGSVNSARSWDGLGTGSAWALEASLLNSCQWKRDSAPAMLLRIPGTCKKAKEKLKRADDARSWRCKCIKQGIFDVREFKICTTALLSDRERTWHLH